MAHPKVAEAAVIGMPHPKWSERPLACVVVKPGETLTKDEVLDFLAPEAGQVAAARRRGLHRRGAEDVGRQVLQEGPARPLRRLLSSPEPTSCANDRRPVNRVDGRPLDGETVVLLSQRAGSAGDLTLEDRVLDAAKACCERWGMAKVTVDDIAAEARCLPGDPVPPVPGRQGQHVRSAAGALDQGVLRRARRAPPRRPGYEDLLVRVVVAATRALQRRRAPSAHARLIARRSHDRAHRRRAAPHLRCRDPVPHPPWFAPHIGTEASGRLAEWLARVVISYFLSPSRYRRLRRRRVRHRRSSDLRPARVPSTPHPGGDRHESPRSPT